MSRRALRVLLLTTDLQSGGTPLRLVRLARGLVARGIEPVVGCLAGEGPLHADLRASGIACFDCGARHRFDLGCIAALADRVRRIDPDIIHATLFHANMAARLVGRRDRARPIVTGSATIEIERRLHRFGEALASGWSDWHVANSHAVAAHLRDDLGFDPARVVVIRNPIDVAAIDAAPMASRAEIGAPADAPLIVWAGRMDPIKGLDTLLRAAASVARERRIALALVGDGPQRAALERYAAEQLPRGAATFLGWRRDAAAWIKAADLFVFPSRTEGAPNSLLEAMAAARPVIASDIAACREIIAPGRTGLLVGAYESAGAWARAIEAALVNLEEVRGMGLAARWEIVGNFRPDRIIDRLVAFYRSIVQ